MLMGECGVVWGRGEGEGCVGDGWRFWGWGKDFR